MKKMIFIVGNGFPTVPAYSLLHGVPRRLSFDGNDTGRMTGVEEGMRGVGEWEKRKDGMLESF